MSQVVGVDWLSFVVGAGGGGRGESGREGEALGASEKDSEGTEVGEGEMDMYVFAVLVVSAVGATRVAGMSAAAGATAGEVAKKSRRRDLSPTAPSSVLPSELSVVNSAASDWMKMDHCREVVRWKGTLLHARTDGAPSR